MNILKAQNNHLFEKMEYVSVQGDTLRYRLLSPEKFDPVNKYPLVLFLHGSGERGSDNEKQLLNGVMNFASNENREKYPCFVVAPQCALNHRWVNVDWKLPAHVMPDTPSVYLNNVLLLIDSLCKLNYIDTNRIYITGLSMGGFGTWDAMMRRPELFAAAVPLCGGADTSKAFIIKYIPVWVFHGAMDNVVLPERSENMVSALKNAGGFPIFTRYPNLAHNIWTVTYSNPELLKWLFNQKRNLK